MKGPVVTVPPRTTLDLEAITLLEAAPCAMLVRSGDGALEILNREGRELLGAIPDSQLPEAGASATLQAYLAGTDVLYPRERLPMVVAMGGAACRVDDLEIRRADTTIRLAVNAAPVFNADGQLSHVVSTFIDITDRTNTDVEHALMDALAHAIVHAPTFGGAVQSALEQICRATGWTFGQAWLPDETGQSLRCEYASFATLPGLAEHHAACRDIPITLGIDVPGRVWLTKQPEWVSDLTPGLQATLGGTVLHRTPPGYRHRLAFPVLAHGEVVAVFGFLVGSRSQNDYRLQHRVTAVMAQIGSWFEARRVRDLQTDRVEVALAVEQKASAQLTALSAMKDTVLQTLAHDLRGPIAAVLTLTAALLADADGAGAIPADLRAAMVANVARSAREMERLLTDLIDSEPGRRVDANRRACDIGDIVADAVSRSTLHDTHPVHLELESVLLAVDAAHVDRIIDNLLGNAAKHVGPGVAVWVKTTATDTGVLITVEDAGVGVPADMAEEIFQPFRRGDPTSKHGLGLGLSLVTRFAQSCGGRAWVEPRPGGGACFKVTLAG